MNRNRSYSQQLHNYVGRLRLGNIKWEDHNQPVEHNGRLWTAIVKINETACQGQGRTKAEAREMAAQHALEALDALSDQR